MDTFNEKSVRNGREMALIFPKWVIFLTKMVFWEAKNSPPESSGGLF
jgi:hypothetical protein